MVKVILSGSELRQLEQGKVLIKNGIEVSVDFSKGEEIRANQPYMEPKA